LDENVFIFAHTLENERGEADLSSSELVKTIMANCHSFALSSEVFRRYSRKADALRGQGLAIPPGIPVMRLLKEAAVTGKLSYISDPPPVTREAELPDDDIPLVRLASAARAILATTDSRLRERLDETGIARENSFEALRPEAALLRAQSTDC
jgi:hypothetical protein